MITHAIEVTSTVVFFGLLAIWAVRDLTRVIRSFPTRGVTLMIIPAFEVLVLLSVALTCGVGDTFFFVHSVT